MDKLCYTFRNVSRVRLRSAPIIGINLLGNYRPAPMPQTDSTRDSFRTQILQVPSMIRIIYYIVTKPLQLYKHTRDAETVSCLRTYYYYITQPPPSSHDLITANTAFVGLDTGAGNLYLYNVSPNAYNAPPPTRRRNNISRNGGQTLINYL